MSIFGRSWDARSSREVTISLGIRETRYAPSRTAWCCMAEMPERALRMLPASLPPPIAGSLILDGGAKSKAVNVVDLRRSCGDGRACRVSNDEARGVNARTLGLYGRCDPNGESGRAPFWKDRTELGGAKSIGFEIQASCFSAWGVGRLNKGIGGGSFFAASGLPLIPGRPPDMVE